MYHIAVCDDDSIYTDKINALVQRYCTRHQISAVVHMYNSSNALCHELTDWAQTGSALSAGAFDLYILDIEMPEMDGMELAALIRRIQTDALIIFITSHLEYAVESYQLSIFRYIPKQLLHARIPAALADAFHYLSLQEGKSFIYTSAGKLLKIPYKNIFYICKDGKNAVFHLTGGPEKIRSSLRQVYQLLSGDDFIFIDRGYIVNISHIQGIKDNDVLLKNGIRLPVSSTRLAETKKAITLFWGKHL